jgi:hypothetical protein
LGGRPDPYFPPDNQRGCAGAPILKQ